MDDNKKLLELSTKIEKLESKDQALDNIREITNKRIDHLSEQIGEVKELFAVLSQEKKENDKRLTSFEKLVEKTRPEQLLLEVRSIQKQQLILEGKLDLVKTRQNKFQENFDKFSEKLKVFRGEDELLKLQKKVYTELLTIEKINRNITLNTSKAENAFIKVKEQATDVITARDELKDMKKELDEQRAEYEKKLNTIQKITDNLPNTIKEGKYDKNTLIKEILEQKPLQDTTNIKKYADDKIEELTDAMIENFMKLKEKIKKINEELNNKEQSNKEKITNKNEITKTNNNKTKKTKKDNKKITNKTTKKQIKETQTKLKQLISTAKKTKNKKELTKKYKEIYKEYEKAKQEDQQKYYDDVIKIYNKIK